MPKTQRIVPSNIYGRLLPNRDVLLSASTPMRGCMTSPERGPARKTMAMDDFERPRERRYGDAYPISTDQKIWTPSKLIVRVGKCNQEGPRIRGEP